MARVLIVGGDASTREMLHRMLVYAGHGVLEAKDNLADIHILRQHHHDLVIVDVGKSEEKSLEVIRKVRQAFPGARTIVLLGSDGLVRGGASRRWHGCQARPAS